MLQIERETFAALQTQRTSVLRQAQTAGLRPNVDDLQVQAIELFRLVTVCTDLRQVLVPFFMDCQPEVLAIDGLGIDESQGNRCFRLKFSNVKESFEFLYLCSCHKQNEILRRPLSGDLYNELIMYVREKDCIKKSMSTCKRIPGVPGFARAKLRIINHGKRMFYTVSPDPFRSEKGREKSYKSQSTKGFR